MFGAGLDVDLAIERVLLRVQAVELGRAQRGPFADDAVRRREIAAARERALCRLQIRRRLRSDRDQLQLCDARGGGICGALSSAQRQFIQTQRVFALALLSGRPGLRQRFLEALIARALKVDRRVVIELVPTPIVRMLRGQRAARQASFALFPDDEARRSESANRSSICLRSKTSSGRGSRASVES
jgi:hypothetical protein